MKKTILGYECKHAIYTKDRMEYSSDLVLVKEIIHYTDGTTMPNLRYIKNPKRTFYLTKPGHRKHQQNKAWERQDRLQRYETTQLNMGKRINYLLNHSYQNLPLRQLCQSPYVYGTDVSITTLIKHQYIEKYPDLITESTCAVLDLETSVHHSDKHILSGTLSFKDRVALIINASFIAHIPTATEQIQSLFEEHLGQYKHDRNITLDIKIVDTPAQVVIELIKRAHQWMPDFLVFWNMNFDVPKMLEALKRENIPAEKVFSHPDLPDMYKYCRHIPGKDKKLTSSGKQTPLAPSERWPTLDTPASWYAIDAMCAFRQLRVGSEPNRPSYALDDILKQELGLGKLKFDIQDRVGLVYHHYMQKHHPLEYLIYNIFDCISVELLDEKNKDLSLTMGLLVGHTDYKHFPSQPKRLCDDLHFFVQNHQCIIGSTGVDMQSDLDKYVISNKQWIVTLNPHLNTQTGLKLVKELPHLRTNIYMYVADLDVTSSYPRTEDILNVSDQTSIYEVFKIEGLSESTRRTIGIDMTAARTNALALAQTLYGFPTLSELTQAYRERDGRENTSS